MENFLKLNFHKIREVRRAGYSLQTHFMRGIKLLDINADTLGIAIILILQALAIEDDKENFE